MGGLLQPHPLPPTSRLRNNIFKDDSALYCILYAILLYLFAHAYCLSVEINIIIIILIY
jgi:hypothetical protein